MSTPTGLITPMSPAMRLLLAALNRAEDSLDGHGETLCADCQEAPDDQCEQKLADEDEAARVGALRDAIERAKDAGEIAAILTGTGVSI